MKFEIADWKFEVTWEALRMQPLDRGRAKTAKRPATQIDRREGAGGASRPAFGFVAQTVNSNIPQKGRAK